MCTAATESSATSATHLCGTLFEFSLEAKDEISKSFEVIAGPNASCQFNETNYFLIHCPKNDETSLSMFSEILRKFIKTESEKRLDMFDDSRLARIRGTYADLSMNRSREMNTQSVTDMGVSDEAVQPNEASGVTNDNGQPISSSRYESSNDIFLIEHETITRTWTPDRKDVFIKLKSKDRDLGIIGALSGCRLLNADLDSVDVVIKGDHEEDVQKAMSKLRVVEKAIYEMQSFPLIFSFPILEGSLAPMLQMVALKDLKDNRVDTTLLPPESPLIGIHRMAFVATMVQGGERVPLRRSGIPHISNEKPRWTDFPYQSFGAQIDDSQKPCEAEIPVANSTLMEDLATPTALWVQRARETQHLDPFQPDPKSQEQSEGMTYRALLEPTPTPIKPSTKRSRAAKGASKAATTSLNEKTLAVVTEVRTPAATPTIIPTAIQAPVHAVTSVETRVEPRSCIQVTSKDMTPRSPTAKENQRLHERVKTPPIASPHNAPSESATPSGSAITADWGSSLVPKTKEGVLIDIHEKSEDTASKKDLRRTMGQKKPRKGLSGSNNESVRAFETAASQVLNLALLCQGPIKIEVGIGRLLVNPQGSFAEFERPFAVTEWSSAFPKNNGVNGLARETIFTARLTTHWPDANAILNIKLSRGQSLFVEEPCERKVTYIISCITKAKERVIIETGEDGSFNMKGSELLVGALDWHFPLRAWDSRLQVLTQEPLMGNYQQQAQGIVRNMQFTVDAVDIQNVNFSTTTIDQELVIQSVQLRRATAHPTNNIYKDIVLHLEEVQDMSLQRISENEYHGSILESGKMIRAGKLWWEASLTSVKAATILKESEEVEIGEMGKWCPKKIVDEGIIKDTYALAKEVVTRIDLVGRKNKGPEGNSDPKTSTKARTSPKTSIPEGPPGMANYW